MPVGPVRPIPSFPLTEDTASVLNVNWLVHTLFPLLLTVMTYPPVIRPVPE